MDYQEPGLKVMGGDNKHRMESIKDQHKQSILILHLDTPVSPSHIAFDRAGFIVTASQSVDGHFLEAFDALIIISDVFADLMQVIIQSNMIELRKPMVCIAPTSWDQEYALLEAGATICLPCNIAPKTLMERTRHLIRLSAGQPCHPHLGDLDLDPIKRQAFWRGDLIPLRPVEFSLLLQLGTQMGLPIASRDLAARLWPNADVLSRSRKVAVHLCHLREKLAHATDQLILQVLPRGGHVLALASARRMRHHD